jgi:cellulose biosynthesis protein BcsQ
MSDLRIGLLMKSIKYLFLIILFYAFAGRAQDKPNIIDDNKIVARLDKDFWVTLKDLRQYIVDWKYQYRFRVKSDIYRNALKNLIVDRLRVFDLFDRGLNENQDLMEKIRRNINYELINAFFDKTFVEKYANEKTAAEAYKEIDKEIICSDITLPIPTHPTKENLDSLKTIASKIETGLGKNYDKDSLIKFYSLKSFKLNAKRKVTWSETMIDPVANVIFRLQKGFTRVVESVDGFHIVKVLDIKKIKLEPFEKMKDKIVSQLQKGYYEAYNNAYDDFRRGRIDKSSIKWNQSGLDQIAKWSSEDARFYAGAYKDTIQNAISNGNNFGILSYNNGNVDLKEYLRLLEEVVILNPNIMLSSASVKDFILDAVYDNNVIMAAKKLGLEKKLINPYTQDPVIADRLLYLYKQAVIEGSIPKATPEALYQFYEDHKDSIFYQLKVVYIYAMIYSDSAKAAADINEIRKGTPFEKVSNAWLVNEYIRERDGSLKAYRTSGGDYLAKAAFKLSLNESAGPVEYDDSTKGKQFAVIKCFQIQPEKQLTYDDVKGKRIEEEFKNYYRQKISDEVDAGLKKKYGVEIFENVLSEAIVSK